MATDLHERLHQAARGPIETVDADTAMRRGDQLLRRRRVTGVAGLAVAVIVGVGAATNLSGPLPVPEVASPSDDREAAQETEDAEAGIEHAEAEEARQIPDPIAWEQVTSGETTDGYTWIAEAEAEDDHLCVRFRIIADTSPETFNCNLSAGSGVGLYTAGLENPGDGTDLLVGYLGSYWNNAVEVELEDGTIVIAQVHPVPNSDANVYVADLEGGVATHLLTTVAEDGEVDRMRLGDPGGNRD